MSQYNPPGKDRNTVWLNPVVVKRAKAKAMLDGITFSEVIERALILYTDNNSFSKSLSASEVLPNKQVQTIPVQTNASVATYQPKR